LWERPTAAKNFGCGLGAGFVCGPAIVVVAAAGLSFGSQPTAATTQSTAGIIHPCVLTIALR